MIAACKTYLINRIKSAGIQTVLEREEDLARYQGKVYAFIAIQDDRLERDGSRVARLTTGYRRRLHKRTAILQFSVTAKTPEDAAAKVTAIVGGLDSRIDDGAGNAVLIRPSAAAREEDKSLLATKATARMDVEFIGGIYRDEPVKRFAMAATDVVLETEITI